MADVADTSGTLTGKRNRAMVDAKDTSDALAGDQEKRFRVGDLHLAFAAKKLRRSTPNGGFLG